MSLAHNPSAVPTIDLAQADAPETLLAIDKACRDHGFFLIRGHGLDATIDRMWDQAQAFFAQSQADKRKIGRTESQPLGFFDQELTKRKRDLKEVFDFTHPDKSVNQWPGEPADFRPCMAQFYQDFSLLADVTLKLVFNALMHSQGVARSTQLPGADTRTSNVRLNYYPVSDPLSPAEQQSTKALGDMALHHHTDPGVITLLLQDATGGLQTQSDAHGWIDVAPEPATVVVNLGDTMQVWTNDMYKAAVHRVTPMQGATRYSTPYFLNPEADSTLAPLTELGIGEPKYRSFSWREFINHRISDNFADVGADDTQISRYLIAA